MMKAFAALVALALTGATATAADWKPLEGTAAVTAQNYLDPAPGERKDSHWRVQLSGESAKELYLAMKGRESKDECTGGVMRQAGQMRCTKLASPLRYACDFSIDLRRQKIDHGVAC